MSDHIVAIHADAETRTFTIEGHGCAVPMTIEEAREVRDTLAATLAAWDAANAAEYGRLKLERYPQ